MFYNRPFARHRFWFLAHDMGAELFYHHHADQPGGEGKGMLQLSTTTTTMHHTQLSSRSSVSSTGLQQMRRQMIMDPLKSSWRMRRLWKTTLFVPFSSGRRQLETVGRWLSSTTLVGSMRAAYLRKWNPSWSLLKRWLLPTLVQDLWWSTAGIPIHSLVLCCGQLSVISSSCCSAGVGRTGVFITMYVQMECIKTQESVDVVNFVHNLRKQRCLMVQTEVREDSCHLLLHALSHCPSPRLNTSSFMMLWYSLLRPVRMESMLQEVIMASPTMHPLRRRLQPNLTTLLERSPSWYCTH